MKPASRSRSSGNFSSRCRTQQLLGEKSVKRLAIAQVYLRAGTSGAAAGIRRARCGDETRYYYTEKTRVTAVTRIEREHEIPAAEFEALLSERDEALRTIEKTRYLVPFEGHTLEIDVFPFWRDRAFCECELQSEDEPLPLPDWLHGVPRSDGRSALHQPRSRPQRAGRDALIPYCFSPAEYGIVIGINPP